MSVDLDIALLRAFVAVVEQGGFSAAARRLNCTQSAVSMQVKRLEDAVGMRLLLRDTRSVRPTEPGETLMRRARRILALNDETVADLRGNGVDGLVRLGTPDDYATCFLPEALSRFARAHPRVQIEARCDMSADLLTLLAAGDLDLVVGTRQRGGPGRLLRREALVWVAARDVEVEGMTPLPLVLAPRGCQFRDFAITALVEQGRDHRIAFISPSLAGIRAAVLGGLGVAVLAHSSLSPDLRLLGATDGFPALPPVDIVLNGPRAGATRAATALAGHLLDSLTHRSATQEVAGADAGQVTIA
jgi:DNA-binding transcriptional LysR family regulator